METTPLVSIIIPAFNDEDVIAEALESCLRQTLDAIEVIVVDDGSTDGTARVVEHYMERDPRVRLIKLERNGSAYQARHRGILAARSEHVLFLDGDDELVDLAAETTRAKAITSGADLVQFGIDVVRRDGTTGGAFEARLEPRHSALKGTEVLTGLFPIDQPAQGQLWRYLFRTTLLRDAYALMPDDLVLPRVNDLPIAFLAAALATRYASVPNHLYRYHFGRGGSGQKIRDLDTAAFYAGAVHSIGTIEAAVRVIASRSTTPDLVLATYESVRVWIMGYTTHYLAEHTREDLRGEAFAHLYTIAPASQIVLATANTWPATIDILAQHASSIELGEHPVRNILLTTSALRPGGVSGVLLSQARLLLRAGLRVTIAAREPGSDTSVLPEGVGFVELVGPDLAADLTQWSDVCRQNDIDLVIDHNWLYSRTSPAFALAARANGASTIAWAHNFAARSILLGLNSLEFQTRNLEGLAQLVVLSHMDVAFWKLRGMQRVVYLPNPPSPLLLESSGRSAPRPAPSGRPIELAWWGRLEQRTKRVKELVVLAAELRRLGVDFRMRIIGPDWSDMTAAQLNALAAEHSVADRVEAVGPLYGKDLLAAIDSSDLFVNTSAIEGYPLTISEAQSRGLPVAMYELPWIALAQGNEGILAVPQGDSAGLAARIAEVVADPEFYARLSAASIAAAERELGYDFASLYQQLVTGKLPAEHSPEPTLEDVRQLIDHVIVFSEHHAGRAHKATRSRVASTGVRAAQNGDEVDRVPTIVTKLTPAARVALDIAPWLRPTALRVKHALLRR